MWHDELAAWLAIGLGLGLISRSRYEAGRRAGRVEGLEALDAVRWDISQMEDDQQDR